MLHILNLIYQLFCKALCKCFRRTGQIYKSCRNADVHMLINDSHLTIAKPIHEKCRKQQSDN